MNFKIFPDILKEIENLPAEENKIIKQFFTKLQPTYSLQKELLTYLLDIKARDEISITELVKMVNNTINNPTLTREQKLTIVRNFLRKRRFPLLTKAEEIFNKKIKNLNLPSKCKIIPPIYWEGDEYEIKFYFKNNKEFIQKLERLLKISQMDIWQQLIDGGWFEEIFSQKNFDR